MKCLKKPGFAKSVSSQNALILGRERERSEPMKKTAIGLVDYCKSKVGTPYFYGSKMKPLTETFPRIKDRKKDIYFLKVI
jgi:hypothetical protein